MQPHFRVFKYTASGMFNLPIAIPLLRKAPAWVCAELDFEGVVRLDRIANRPSRRGNSENIADTVTHIVGGPDAG